MIPALSSAEAESNAGVKSIGAALGLQADCRVLGFDLKRHADFDSTGALGTLKRTGLGQVRHIATPLLWVQAIVAQGRCTVSKKPGKENIADAGTKYLTGPELERHILNMGFVYLDEIKHSLALNV